MRRALRLLLSLSAICPIGITLASSLRSAEPQFERVQLTSEFYSEGGTFGDYNGDGKGDVAVGPFIYWGPGFEKKSRYYEGPAIDPIGYSENFLMYSDDVDADGKRDILVLGFPGKESWWYQNPGHDKADGWIVETSYDARFGRQRIAVDRRYRWRQSAGFDLQHEGRLWICLSCWSKCN